MSWRIICLICDGKTGSIRRLKPHNLYVCVQCIKLHGPMDLILAAAEQLKAAFLRRHPGAKAL